MAWYMNIDGFFSVVQNREDHDTFLVRARRRDDLERLNKRLDEPQPILEWAGADYPYRIILQKALWADYVAQMAMEIDYSNFKSCVPVADYARERAYHQCWMTLMGLEEEKA